MKNTKVLGVFLIVLLLVLGIIFVRSGQKKEQPTQAPPVSTEKVHNLVPKPSDAGKRIEGQIVVKFKSKMTDAQINQYLQPYQAKIIRKIEALNRYVIQVPAGQEDTILQKLSQDQLIENAEPDYEVQADASPNDPLYAFQWGLSNKGQTIVSKAGKVGADVKAETAWNVTKGNGVKVAVIDSGINLNHPDFAGQIVEQRSYISDTVEDFYGHGTHVAGAIAALGNNAKGITGVCPECKLLIAKVLNDEGTGSSTNVAAAMIWAADQGAKVINISAGGKAPTQTMMDAVTYVYSKGGIVVCSAGNEGDTAMTYPSAFEAVVSVAATDNKDLLASFSTRGTWVKVAAPGVNMMSTLPTHAFNLQLINPSPLNTANDFLSGTSMAAPIVSGVLGLMWATPYGTSNTAVVQRLYSTADKIAGTGTYWSYGRINAAQAVGANDVTPTTAEPSPTVAPTIAEATITPTPTPVTPTFTCLGACVTTTPTPSPTHEPDPTEPIQPTETQPSVPATTVPGQLPPITDVIKSIFKTKNCPTGGTGLVSSFNKKGGGKGGYGKNRGSKGKYKKGGGKSYDKKNRTSQPKQDPCVRNGILEQIALLLSKLLELLFGTPQPQPAPAPAPQPTGACKPRPPCLDDPTNACLLPEPAEGWCPITPTPSCKPKPPCLDDPTNACLLPEPAEGWCPTTPTPKLSCIPRPACLDGNPACLPPEPAEGWCPATSPTQACAQVITKAINPETKECKEFPTSCLPSPWVEDSTCVVPNSSLKGD